MMDFSVLIRCRRRKNSCSYAWPMQQKNITLMDWEKSLRKTWNHRLKL